MTPLDCLLTSAGHTGIHEHTFFKNLDKVWSCRLKIEPPNPHVPEFPQQQSWGVVRVTSLSRIPVRSWGCGEGEATPRVP